MCWPWVMDMREDNHFCWAVVTMGSLLKTLIPSAHQLSPHKQQDGRRTEPNRMNPTLWTQPVRTGTANNGTAAIMKQSLQTCYGQKLHNFTFSTNHCFRAVLTVCEVWQFLFWNQTAWRQNTISEIQSWKKEHVWKRKCLSKTCHSECKKAKLV